MSDHAAAANLQKAQRGRRTRRATVVGREQPVLVFFGPPGAGKSTVIRKLLADYPNDFQTCVTHTSRAPREGESDGVHYHFRSAEKLRESAGKPGVFVEWVEAYGNFYGTSRYAVEAVARTGRSAILDLNVEGARQVADNKLVGPRASFIYVVPPSADALEGRMRTSAEMSEEAIAQRIAAAREELAAGAELVEILGRCTTVVNDVLADAHAAVRAAAADCRPLRLSSALAQRSLAQLGQVAHGDTLAYLAMKLGGAELASATLVEEYPSLQTVDLSGCRLKCTNLGPLAPLTTLLHLSLARNRLGVMGQDELADVLPPSIITLDVSQNELTSGTAWVHKLRRLRSLKAAHNRIDALPFAGELHGLTSLDLSHNFLAADEMLIATEIHCLPPSLRHLDLSHNGLATLKRLPPLPHLMTLEVAHNQLDNFDGLAACSTLCELNLAHNALATVAQLAPLKSLQGLHSLRIAGNPLCDFEGYRLHALCPLPQLHTLDGGAAAVEERVKAINVHTAHGANAAWEAIEYVATAKEALEVAAEAAATAGHDDAMWEALEQSATLFLSRWGMASA